MSQNRLSAYKIMWIFCFFDLPTNTPEERKSASKFRNNLLKDGFKMMQYSVYVRHCPSAENTQVHIKRIEMDIPLNGDVKILKITDKQYGDIKNFSRYKHQPIEKYIQLTLF